MKSKKINYFDFFSGNIISFLFKMFVVFSLLNITITLSAKKLSIPEDSMVITYIKGLVVNPEAFIFAHDKHFKLKKYEKAACDLRYAEGLINRVEYSKDILLRIEEKKNNLQDLGFVCN